MALIAEQIVEEWLIRQGFFTIRGLKIGLHEIDLLAIKKSTSGWQKVHVEVQVSIRPVRYISGITNAKKREDFLLEQDVDNWLQKKFHLPQKQKLREKLSDSDGWEYWFVYGHVKERKEIEFIEKRGVRVVSFMEILSALRNPTEFRTGVATDIMDLIGLSK